jgi:holo-[acyl-carrier protein] synthase
MIVGLGVDLFDVTRMRAELSRHGSDLGHLFAPAEIAQCLGLPCPDAELAARFAAKEAVVKALGDQGHGGPCWPEIEIHSSAHGHRAVTLRGRFGARARALGVTRIHLSTAHATGVAVASAVLEARP